MNYNYQNKHPYSNYIPNYYSNSNSSMNQNPNIMYAKDERGFFFPFVLGGLTGGLIASRPPYGGFYPTPYPPYPIYPYPPRPFY